MGQLTSPKVASFQRSPVCIDEIEPCGGRVAARGARAAAERSAASLSS